MPSTLNLPVAVQRCLLGCALHLRRHPGVVGDAERLRRELCPACAAAMRRAGARR
jgi:hypothetical protein